jgi:hypothetical protein
MKDGANRKHISHSPRSSEKIHGSLRRSFISRLPNTEILADVRKQTVGIQATTSTGRYVYLEPAIQAKAIVNIHSLF